MIEVSSSQLEAAVKLAREKMEAFDKTDTPEVHKKTVLSAMVLDFVAVTQCMGLTPPEQIQLLSSASKAVAGRLRSEQAVAFRGPTPQADFTDKSVEAAIKGAKDRIGKAALTPHLKKLQPDREVAAQALLLEAWSQILRVSVIDLLNAANEKVASRLKTWGDGPDVIRVR